MEELLIEWGYGDSYFHAKEIENNEPSVPVDIEVFHQSHHDRTEVFELGGYSIRQERIRKANE